MSTGARRGGGGWRVGVGSRYVHEHGCPQGVESRCRIEVCT